MGVMSTLATTVASNIKCLREAAKLSQAELGAEIGEVGQTIWRWENEATWPSADQFASLAAFFDVDPGTLLSTKMSKRPAKKSELDPKIRQALSLICRTFGYRIVNR